MFSLSRTSCLVSATRELQQLSKTCARPFTFTLTKISNQRQCPAASGHISPAGSSIIRHLSSQEDPRKSFKEKVKTGPSLEHFIANSGGLPSNTANGNANDNSNAAIGIEQEDCDVPYLSKESYNGNGRTGIYVQDLCFVRY